MRHFFLSLFIFIAEIGSAQNHKYSGVGSTIPKLRESNQVFTSQEINTFEEKAIPFVYDSLYKKLPPPANQEGTNFCWAFSTTYAVSYYENKNHKDSFFYSDDRKSLNSEKLQSVQYTILQYLKDSQKDQICLKPAIDYEVLGSILYDFGSISENRLGSSLNCSTYNFRDSYLDSLEKMAKFRHNYRLVTVHEQPNLAFLRRIVSKNTPIVATLVIDETSLDALQNKPNTRFWNNLPINYYKVGIPMGHCILIVGYNDTIYNTGAFRILNSWGSNLGENGYLWVSYHNLRSTCSHFSYIEPISIEKEERDTSMNNEGSVTNSKGFDSAKFHWVKSGYYINFIDFHLNLDYLNVREGLAKIRITKQQKTKPIIRPFYIKKGEVVRFYIKGREYKLKYHATEYNKPNNFAKPALVFGLIKPESY